MDLKEIIWDGMDWNNLAHEKDKWQAVVSTVMNVWVPKRTENFSTIQGTVTLLRRVVSC